MKKIISLVLAMIIVLSMGVVAFAEDVGSVPEHDHEWSEWEYHSWGRSRTCEICGVTEYQYYPGIDEDEDEEPSDDDEDEENPDTGAAGAIGMVALASAAAAASAAFKRK